MDSDTRKSRITIPERCHPLAKFVFSEMARQRLTYMEAEYRSGVLKSTIKGWRNYNRPGLETVEAVLGVLGWSLLPVPDCRTIPAALRADLEEVATRHALGELPVLQFIAACSDYGWRVALADRADRGSFRPSHLPVEPAAEAEA